jgi:fructose-bisphosphate aldolase/2-amino-3,7-dideoxy-D-threo-hept-6-ulosonate synthase
MDLRAQRLHALMPGGRGVWVPIDHGASDWPVPGLHNPLDLVRALRDGGADAIVAQKGLISHVLRHDEGIGLGLVAHLSVSTRHGGPEAGEKVSVGDVEEAIARGAHAVSAQVNIGTPGEGRMIERMGVVTRDAFHQGIPTLGMVYARGEHLNAMPGDMSGGQAHGVRLAFELGCDVAKAAWTGEEVSFRTVVDAAPIPVLVAGGPRTGDDEALLHMVHLAMNCGAAGVCMGRQIFAHPHPDRMVRAIASVVHRASSVDEAMRHLGG